MLNSDGADSSHSIKAMLASLMAWYAGALEQGGYPLIVGMMAMESTFLPLPSELIIPPAAHLAHIHPGGTFSIPGIIIAGTIGSWLGATIMYWISRVAGRPLLVRYGRLVFISPEKLAGAERWSTHFGSMGIFISRFLPVVRHLIGIPAGLVKMDYRWFSISTLLGSGIWCSILCWLGIKAGQDEKLMQGDYRQIVLWVVGIMAALGVVYYLFVHRQMKQKPAN